MVLEIGLNSNMYNSNANNLTGQSTNKYSIGMFSSKAVLTRRLPLVEMMLVPDN